MEKIFKFEDKFLDYDTFVDCVMESLKQYNYASADIIALAKKAKVKEVKNAMKDGVVRYIRDNQNIVFKELCSELKVKTSIVRELAQEGRIKIDNSELEEINNEFKNIEIENSKKNKLLCLKEQNNNLKKTDLKASEKKGVVFHTRDSIGMKRL